MNVLRKKFVIGIVAIAVILLVSFNYLLTSAALSGVPVLNYHQINDEAHNVLTLSSYEFDAQMAYLHKSGYHTITPEQLIDYFKSGQELPPNPILITFDDGYEDNYRVAYPILQKYDFKATIFLITDFVGNNSRYLNWQQVREMDDNGISFASHTVSHIKLTDADDEELSKQLVNSKESLERHLHKEVNSLAYPGGVYDQRVMNAAKQAGYQAAFTINLGRDKTHCGMLTLHRIPIFAGAHSFLHFWLRLKFTQTFMVLQNVKDKLNHFGVGGIAKLIYIP